MRRGPGGLKIKYSNHCKIMEIPIGKMDNYYPEKVLQEVTEAIVRERLVQVLLNSYDPMRRGEFLIKFFVHDEIIFEVEDEKIKSSNQIIDKIMSKSMNISLPGMLETITIPKFKYKLKISKHYR